MQQSSSTVAVKTPRNEMHGFRNLMRQWDGAAPTNIDARPPSPSALGNINDEASPDCFKASIFPPADPRFALSLEPGVRDLVLTLVNGCGWVTYTSCEGHPRHGETPRRRRNVGLVARTTQDYDRMVEAVSTAVQRANRRRSTGPVLVEAVKYDLNTEDGPVPSLFIDFLSNGASWDDYKAQADTLQAALVDELKAGADIRPIRDAYGRETHAEHMSRPFAHATALTAVDPDFCHRLRAEMCEEDWHFEVNGADHTAHYQPNLAQLVTKVSRAGEDVVAAARSVAESFGQPLSTCLSMGAHRMTPGNLIDIHSDDPMPGFPTHRVLLYLNQDGRDYDGGELRFYTAKREDAQATAYSLDAGMMLAFLGCGKSFHAVTPITRGERIAVTFYFYHIGNCPRRINRLRDQVAAAVAAFPMTEDLLPAAFAEDNPDDIKASRRRSHLIEIAALLMSFGVAQDVAASVIAAAAGDDAAQPPSAHAEDVQTLTWWAVRLSAQLHCQFLAERWEEEAAAAREVRNPHPLLAELLETMYGAAEPSVH